MSVLKSRSDTAGRSSEPSGRFPVGRLPRLFAAPGDALLPSMGLAGVLFFVQFWVPELTLRWLLIPAIVAGCGVAVVGYWRRAVRVDASGISLVGFFTTRTFEWGDVRELVRDPGGKPFLRGTRRPRSVTLVLTDGAIVWVPFSDLDPRGVVEFIAAGAPRGVELPVRVLAPLL